MSNVISSNLFDLQNQGYLQRDSVPVLWDSSSACLSRSDLVDIFVLDYSTGSSVSAGYSVKHAPKSLGFYFPVIGIASVLLTMPLAANAEDDDFALGGCLDRGYAVVTNLTVPNSGNHTVANYSLPTGTFFFCIQVATVGANRGLVFSTSDIFTITKSDTPFPTPSPTTQIPHRFHPAYLFLHRQHSALRLYRFQCRHLIQQFFRQCSARRAVTSI